MPKRHRGPAARERGPGQRSSPIPLYVQIEEDLRGSIRSGELPPQSQIPSETELSDRFQVSRMTARKALDRLVSDGVLFRRAGKGTFVSHPKIAHRPSQQISFSAAMNALGLRHSTRVLHAGIVPAPGPVASALAVAVGSSVVMVRRLRSVEGEPAAIHASYLPAQYAPILEGDLTGSLTELMRAAGVRVAHSRDNVEAVVADHEEAGLLGVTAGAPLLLIHGAAYSATLEPLRYTQALYRGGRFRFTVDTSGPAELQMELTSTAPLPHMLRAKTASG